MRATDPARRGTRATTACRRGQRVVPGDAGRRGQRVLPRLSGPLTWHPREWADTAPHRTVDQHLAVSGEVTEEVGAVAAGVAILVAEQAQAGVAASYTAAMRESTAYPRGCFV